jgi:ABC-type uncharacterized transport system ATPase component
MITHDLTHGLNLCDRTVILNRGRIAAEVEKGQVTPSEFLELYTEHTRSRKRSKAQVGK